MASRTFDGVTFRVYPYDHAPRHVYGFNADIEVIVDLREDGTVALASRTDAIRPGNAGRSDIRHILRNAAEQFAELVVLWEKHHG